MAEALRSWLHTGRIIVRNLRRRKFESEIHFLHHFLKPGDVCLHIGASDGRHSFVMSELIGDGHIHCFEPSPYTYRILNRIVRFHGLHNVTTYNAAMGNQPGTTNLITPIKRSGSVGLSFAFISDTVPDKEQLRKTRGFRDLVVRKVDVLTIDAFCASKRIEHVHFLRCDAEGAEIVILEGGRETIERDRPVMLIEVHPYALRDQFGSSHQAIRDFLVERRYRTYYVDAGTLKQTDEFFDEPWRDYFCVPSERAAGLV